MVNEMTMMLAFAEPKGLHLWSVTWLEIIGGLRERGVVGWGQTSLDGDGTSEGAWGVTANGYGVTFQSEKMFWNSKW